MPKLRNHSAFIAFLFGFLVFDLQKVTGQSEQVAQNSGTTPTFRVSTGIVVLDVVVTDTKGHLVHRNLEPDDFSVLEDGQPQKIRGFSSPSEHSMPSRNEMLVISAS